MQLKDQGVSSLNWQTNRNFYLCFSLFGSTIGHLSCVRGSIKERSLCQEGLTSSFNFLLISGCAFYLTLTPQAISHVVLSRSVVSDSLPLLGYSVHWIFQARILEWVAISFSFSHVVLATFPSLSPPVFLNILSSLATCCFIYAMCFLPFMTFLILFPVLGRPPFSSVSFMKPFLNSQREFFLPTYNFVFRLVIRVN